MPFTITMPKLSPTMEEGTITKWRKKEGDFIKAGDVLFEVATDKATVEHTALDDGFLCTILVQEGSDAVVNQAVGICSETKDEDITQYVPEGVVPSMKTLISDESESLEPLQSQGPQQKAAASSTLTQPSFIPEPPIANYDLSQPYSFSKRLKVSPLARRLAKEKGIDLFTVKGSGPHGRIVSSDLVQGQQQALVPFGRHQPPSIMPGAYDEIPLTPMRKVIASRLQQSKTFIPHFYIMQDIDAQPMTDVREQLKVAGHKVTFNDFIIRALALTLRQHPEMNSGFNTATSSIIRFRTVDISVAVSIPEGLITPIVRHADHKNIGQLSAEVRYLAQRAKDGKLTREEYSGGSFTISNLGMYGVSSFAGIINPPQAGILSVGGIEDRPVIKNQQVVPGRIMTLTLSADHRVVDGADGAKFMKTLQKFLENPSVLVL